MRIPTSPQRSRMMSSIRGKNTQPELALRKALFSAGFRYRLHERRLPGSPDLVFPKYKAALFVHGCFWHRHEGCRYTTMPQTNVDFWTLKFEKNVDRDARNIAALRDAGWRVAVVWECALKHSPDEACEKAANWLRGRGQLLTIG
ncbi:very short patch repair endonuclease [Caballeronia sordidicola]|nr:very short patch repair endonuclease [Caballeronia sordidicola]